MEQHELRASARRFAGELSSVLNNTVCHGIRIECLIDPASQQAVLGYQISRDQLTTSGIPLTLGKKPASMYVGLQVRLEPDDTDGDHLMVTTSMMSICADEDLDEELLHYDYERNKSLEYPEAHVQVVATTPVWETIRDRRRLGDRTLASLHLPVGGRRYRPILEDVIEMLVVEGLADCHPKWRDAVEAGRERFTTSQLSAAIRRYPDIARAAVAALEV